jgi:hypothetical protein
MYASQNIVWVFKPRRMRWVGYVAHVGEMKNAYKILVGKPERMSHSEELGVDRKIILK